MMNLRKMVAFSVLLLATVVLFGSANAEAKKKYTVSAKSQPVNGYRYNAAYNSKSKTYFMLRSYLEQLGKKGGGTLTLKKGTYKVCSPLSVPSNVTIKLKNGAKLLKTNVTGTKSLKAGNVLLQLVIPSKSNKKNSIKKYAGSKNVVIQGTGTATISLNKLNNNTGIAMAHNSAVTVSKVKFMGRKGGSYLAVSGCKNVTVKNCKFYKGTDVSASTGTYDIRLENAAKTTDEFAFTWSKLDNTKNAGIKIQNNLFQGSKGAVGTLKYASPLNSKKVNTPIYQTGIVISGNKLKNVTSYQIRGVAWSEAQITGNTFYRTDKKYSPTGVTLRGVKNPVVQGNTFKQVGFAIYLDTAVNSGKGKGYPVLGNAINGTSKTAMRDNKVTNASHYYVPCDTGLASLKRYLYFVDTSDNNLVMPATLEPYREHYTNYTKYVENTKAYYAFQSYIDQLQACGGGTLTVQAGTYNISNAIYVPSNITIFFDNGVTMNKTAATYTADISTNKAIFVLVDPDKAYTAKSVSGYNGTQNVKLEGRGTVTFNCNNTSTNMAVVMGHCNNVVIDNIKFMRQTGSHLIELNSSQNVTVQNCSFSDFTPSTTDLLASGNQKTYKESINIDGTDEKTAGFNYDWSAHDKTTCNGITVQNNTFYNIGAAVGSHTYTGNAYHVGVKLFNNTVSSARSAAFHALNWKDCEITGNQIENVCQDTTNARADYDRYAISLRGVINPTIKNNTFRNCYKGAICIRKTQTALPSTSGYESTVSSISNQNWADMKNNTVYVWDGLVKDVNLGGASEESAYKETDADYPASYLTNGKFMMNNRL